MTFYNVHITIFDTQAPDHEPSYARSLAWLGVSERLLMSITTHGYVTDTSDSMIW